MPSAANILAGDPVPRHQTPRSPNSTCQSAAGNAAFEEFTADCLTSIGSNTISRFNDYIVMTERSIEGNPAGHRAIPDMLFCRQRSRHDGIPDVLIEFRGPSMVWGARGSARPAHDRSDDSIRMTTQ